jgi:hypothetical protein
MTVYKINKKSFFIKDTHYNHVLCNTTFQMKAIYKQLASFIQLLRLMD